MEITITNSMDWPEAETNLWRGVPVSMRRRKDVQQLIRNIYSEVKELSKLELAHRRSPSKDKESITVAAQVEKINKQIREVQVLLTFGLLVLK